MQNVIEFIDHNNVVSLLDIGANTGRFSQIVKHFFPVVDVFMLEANPFCDKMLERTGIPYEIACLSDEKKTVKLYVNKRNMVCTGVSYYKEKTIHYRNEDFMNVETQLLDEVILKKFGEQKAFEFIKMDTQGSEIDIIKGGLKTINQAKFVQIETSIEEYNEGAPFKDTVFDFMKDIGFKPLEMVEEHKHEDRIVQEDWIFAK